MFDNTSHIPSKEERRRLIVLLERTPEDEHSEDDRNFIQAVQEKLEEGNSK
jgi:hypothetical protein